VPISKTMRYKKEVELLEHYNKFPEGGTTVFSSEQITKTFEVLGLVPRVGAKVLDLGCASGITCNILTDMYDMKTTGVDFCGPRIARAKKLFPKLKFVKHNIHSFLKKETGKYDFIILFDIIEHLENPAEVVESAKKLLKPGGVIIGRTPLNFPYSAHLQVYKTIAEFRNQLNPTRVLLQENRIISAWTK